MSDAVAEARRRYADEVMVWARQSGLPIERVQGAFGAVPRERFLTPPPWRILAAGGAIDDETSDPAQLYRDVLVVLDRRLGINNGQPSLHAAWIAGVAPQPGETIVQVGVGAGYYTAILAHLVGPDGRIEAYEIEPRLAEMARNHLACLPQVAVHATSGVGAFLPAADIVYVAAGAAMPDAAWLRALRPGGRLIFPWQPVTPDGQTMLVHRAEGGWRVRLYGAVSFVGCVGAAAPDRAGSERAPSPAPAPRSVWLTEDRPPDETAILTGAGVWLSSRDL